MYVAYFRSEVKVLAWLWLIWGCGATEESVSVAPTQMSSAGSENTASSRSGAEVYQEVCINCHLANGEGVSGAFPPLAGSEWLAKDNSVVIRIILHGLMGKIEVRGKTYTNVMAAWGGQLNDDEVADVITYIRSSWGNDWPPVTAEEVAAVRTEFSGHGLWRPEELE